MADSLRDQLVKSGLATASQARKAERQNRADTNTQRQARKKGGMPDGSDGDPDSPANVRERARKQKGRQKADRDRAIARVANEKSAAKALRAEITQIIRQNDQRVTTNADDDVPYNFVHGKKVKRIYVQKTQREQLSAGRLVIVNNHGRYHLVSEKVAGQISARDPDRIVAAHGKAAHDSKSAKPADDDDYYAKFEVPDDLDW